GLHPRSTRASRAYRARADRAAGRGRRGSTGQVPAGRACRCTAALKNKSPQPPGFARNCSSREEGRARSCLWSLAAPDEFDEEVLADFYKTRDTIEAARSPGSLLKTKGTARNKQPWEIEDDTRMLNAYSGRSSVSTLTLIFSLSY